MTELDTASLVLCAPADADPLGAESEAVARARTDPAAFGRLYRAHYRAVAGCIYRRVGDLHVAEDLAADVFIAAFRGLGRYRHGSTPFRYWLLRIATNRVHRWVRGQRRAAASLKGAPPKAPPSEMVHDVERLRLALARLSAGHQAVIGLYYLEQLSVEQVAAVLGCSPGTVKSRLARARDALRSHLSDGDPA